MNMIREWKILINIIFHMKLGRSFRNHYRPQFVKDYSTALKSVIVT